MDVAAMASQANALESTQNKGDVVENPKGKLDKDDFLKLLVTQLKYQDPLNPVTNDQFIEENTMFSQLEQLTNISKAIDDMSKNYQKNDRAYAASFLGKYISTNSNKITVNNDKITTASFTLLKEADVTVNIVDSKGNTVASVDMGKLSAGVHKFTWDGKDSKGNSVPNGEYTVIFTATDSSGKSVLVGENAGKVVSVQFMNDGVVLVTDTGEKVNLNDVKSVSEATPSTSSTSGGSKT